MPSWRNVAAVVMGLLIVSSIGIWVVVPILFRDNHESIAATTELSCRLGAFFVGQPVVRQPGQNEVEFEATIAHAKSFLRALKDADCSGVHGASITTQQIRHEIHRLQRAGGGGANQSGSPPTQPPGGGGHGQPPPPSGSGPPPGTTTTTPPPTTTTTGTVEKICHLTTLGTRICHTVGVG